MKIAAKRAFEITECESLEDFSPPEPLQNYKGIYFSGDRRWEVVGFSHDRSKRKDPNVYTVLWEWKRIIW